jgi:rubrerythrin
MLYDELFDNALAIEREIERLYRVYADLFRADAESAGLFAELAAEEERHVRILAALDRAVVVRGPTASPLPMIKSQRDLLDLLERYLAEAAAGMELRDALRNAFRLENSIPEKSLKRIRAIVAGGPGETVQRLSDETVEHARRVREFARSRQIRFSGEG